MISYITKDSGFNVVWYKTTVKHNTKEVNFILIFDLNVNGKRATDDPAFILEYIQIILKKSGNNIIDYKVIIRDINLEWFVLSFQENMAHNPINVQSRSLGFSSVGFTDYPEKAIEQVLKL